MKKASELWTKVNKTALWLLDFLLPRSKRAKEIADITSEEFLNRVKPAESLPISNARALFSYKDPLVKDTIWLLKYKRNKKAGEILGALLGNFAVEWLADLELFENFENPIIVPVPMGKNRLKERVVNQCETLCEEIIKTLPTGVAVYSPFAISKIKETGSQSHTKNRAERLKNLSGSFNADSKIVRGRNIILVDDVITTGATIEETRKTLVASGARKVFALAVAH